MRKAVSQTENFPSATPRGRGLEKYVCEDEDGVFIHPDEGKELKPLKLKPLKDDVKSDDSKENKGENSNEFLALLSKSLGGVSGFGANKIFRLTTAVVVDVAADSSGVISTSTRFGNPAIWTGYSTIAALFQRFRVVGVEAYAVQHPANTSSSSTQNAMYCEFSANAVTDSLSAILSTSNGKLFNVGGGISTGSHVIRPILKQKIKPSQQWFDLLSETQRGCVAYRCAGHLASANAFTLWLKIFLEVNGLLL